VKDALRLQYRRLRRQHVAGLQQQLDRNLAGWLQAQPRICLPDRHLGLFWPLGGEPDLRAPLRALQRPLALPVVQTGSLRYRPWPPGLELMPDDCGIPAPAAALKDLPPARLQLLLVPALALDGRGVRLGSGGGWYDRLRSDPLWRAVPALTVLPSACLVDRLPADPWDIPFDGWIDERGCHWLG